MDRFVIEGGYPLRGKVRVGGSKNSALPILAATLLADEPCEIRGVPHLKDIATMGAILRELGMDLTHDEQGTVRTVPLHDRACTAPYDLVKTMRASFCVLGPLLARRGQARVSLPGGCVIGTRPVDLHLKGLKALGARLDVEHGYVEMEAMRLRGAEIFLMGDFGSTVLGTDNVLMAAVLAEGTTVIEGAACEPEVLDLCHFLSKMGAKIQGVGTHRLVVHGVKHLRGADHEVIPDRIEAGTLLAAAALTGGRVEIENIRLDHLGAVADRLRQIGAEVGRSGRDRAVVSRQGDLRPAVITTLPFPGFPTDLQAQFMVLLSLADGISIITEKVYPDRFMHMAELNRLGAQVHKEGSSAIIHGVRRLSGAEVMASDLRASAALVLAGLIAEGTTQVHRVYHIDRGYEKFEEKLETLGAKVRREAEEEGVEEEAAAAMA